MQQAIVLSLIVVAALSWVVVTAFAFRALMRTHHHVAQCSKIASELASSLARCKKLEIEVAELVDVCDRLGESVNKWRGRAARAAQRETEDESKLQGPAWKEAMRKKLRLGVVVGREKLGD